ncbi:MAG: aldehyde dehydrogenase family protein [Acidimicrobiia bacterium]|nr:aldehyde dehydrogenase family protein [Acidimicrobiia bacterium]
MDTAHIDRDLAALSANKQTWASLPIADKVTYLHHIREATGRVARPWVEAAVKAKGLSMDDPLAGEEWTSGPFAVLTMLDALVDTFERLAAATPLLDGYVTRTTDSGQIAVEVFPSSLDDKLMFSGYSAEVWMEPGVTPDSLDETVAGLYRNRETEGMVQVVLAAGNIASIAPLDVIHAMFNEDRVVVMKMNPVNDYLGEFMEAIFAELIADGYMAVAYGGVDVGVYLTTHEAVDSIHITGSAHTHDAIVFGNGEEGAANKAAGRRVNERPIGSELGGVSPIIVVPGPWSARDVRFQAEEIVSQKMHNGGFNCVAAQILVVPEGWDRTPELLAEIRKLLGEIDDRHPYYPGTLERCAAAIDRPRGVEIYGDGHPRYLLPHLDPNDADEVMFSTEVFGPVLGVVSIEAPDVASYLIKSVRFSNERLYGTLGANILIHPRTAKAHRSALDRAITDLEYGTIAVNTWTGAAYFMPKCAWGAFPGHTAEDIQSGSGFVHNALLFDRAQKSIVSGPFAPAERAWMKGEFHGATKPVYFVSNRRAHEIGERVISYTMEKRPADLARMASAAVRG